MRHGLMIGGVAMLGALLAVAPACSGSSNSAVDEDAGSSGSSGSSGRSSSGSSGSSGDFDAGKTDPDPDDASTTPDAGKTGALRTGVVFLIGVTSDNQIVYTVEGPTADTRAVEAVPVTGGTPAKLGTVELDDDVAIGGSTVAFWTAVDPTTAVGTLHLWTKAGGVKMNVATQSVPGIFSSSLDGSKIAFSFNSPAETADLAVTTPGAPSTTANTTTAIVPNVNVVSQDCPGVDAFAGNVYFSLHCVGAGAALTAASLLTVPASASPTPTTLINGATSAAVALKPGFLSTDKAGTKAYVMGGPNDQGRVVTVAGGGVQNIELNTASGFMTDDGTAVLYRTAGNAFKRALTSNGTATTLVAAGTFMATLDIAPDKSRVVFNQQAPVQAGANAPLFDLKMADTTTPNQTPVDVLTAQTGYPVGFTGSSTHLLFLSDVAAGQVPVGKLKVRTVTGAANERDVATGVTPAQPLPTGTKALFMDNVKQVGQDTVVDIKIFDAAKTAAPTLVVAGVEGFFQVAGTKLVYTKPGATGGLYAIDLP